MEDQELERQNARLVEDNSILISVLSQRMVKMKVLKNTIREVKMCLQNHDEIKGAGNSADFMDKLR